MDYRKEISKLLLELEIGMEQDEIIKSLETPPNKEMGDFAFPCFRLSKQLRKSPVEISKDFESKIESPLFSKIVATGPYLNFFVDEIKFNESVLRRIFSEKQNYGSSKIGQGKNIVIDYSSTNIAKPFHIGHIRSCLLYTSPSPRD